ncbi:hypothetical protein M758_11G056000 [Ceratodon purpureus]|nr:hypothetical protein M758_11G056000 [Ceratodon purpureus]
MMMFMTKHCVFCFLSTLLYTLAFSFCRTLYTCYSCFDFRFQKLSTLESEWYHPLLLSHLHTHEYGCSLSG